MIAKKWLSITILIARLLAPFFWWIVFFALIEITKEETIWNNGIFVLISIFLFLLSLVFIFIEQIYRKSIFKAIKNKDKIKKEYQIWIILWFLFLIPLLSLFSEIYFVFNIKKHLF